MDELGGLTAAETARRIRRGELSAREAVEDRLTRIERLNPKLNAFVQVVAESARAAAAAADEAQAAGRPLGTLHGVPLSIKSSIDVAGLRCECGSRFRQSYTPDRDAPLVERLRRAGAILLGVTNTPDILMAYETDNFLYGRTNHPQDPELTPGGSSGGEAAAIAGGLSAAGFGSDGGGSVRVPASFCGLYGLKPTPGVIPRTGHWPACLATGALLGLIGPMTRSAEDQQLLLEAVAGLERHDPSAAPVSVAPPAAAELERVRIGVIEEDPAVPVAAEIRAAVRRAADAFADQGFAVESVRFPGGWFERARACWWKLFGVAGRTLVDPLIRGREADVHPLSWGLFATLEETEAMTYPKFLDAWVERDRLRGELLDLLERTPALLLPVASVNAFPHGRREWALDGRKAHYPAVFAYSQVFNLTGPPALAVPTGADARGLPLGVQIVARPFQDALAVALAGRLATDAPGASNRNKNAP